MSMQIVLFRLQKSRWEGHSSLSVKPAYFQNIRRVVPWCLIKQRDKIPARNVTTRMPRVRPFFLTLCQHYAPQCRATVAREPIDPDASYLGVSQNNATRSLLGT